MAPAKLSLLDAMFLAGETRESMMHVGGLFLFSPPKDASPTFLRDVTDELLQSTRAHPPWSLKLRSPNLLADPRQAWVDDEAFDLDYHLRRSALPSPGDERELGRLVSRLHSGQIDFHRPPWEFHIIEGLQDGRFALYAKIHHSLVDGYTGMKLLQASLSSDESDRESPMFWARARDERVPRQGSETGVPSLSALLSLARGQVEATKVVGRAILNVARAVTGGDPALPAPLQAPSTIFNGRISRNRRFATQQYDLERVREIAHRYDGTLNDMVLALCGAALRRLLAELGELPAKPLVCMLPVNIRPKDDPGGGNAVGAILASLATDIADPIERLRATIASTRRAKEQLEGMSKSAILQYTALLMTPMAIQQITNTGGRTRPAFNLVISNVPGPQEPLYFRGARMEGVYPLSIPFHGYGLNITVTSYAGTLNFGFTGCRDALPHLQRLAIYGVEALEEIEAAG